MKLNRTHIKLLVAVFILADAFARIFLKANSVTYQLCKALGNCAVGLLCFLLADGFDRSANKIKYALRLLVISIVCYIPFNLYEDPWIMIGYGNVFKFYFPFPFNLLISMLTIMAMEKIRSEDFTPLSKGLLELICSVVFMCISTFCAYPIYTLMLVLNYYYNKDDQRAKIVCFLFILLLIVGYNIRLYNLTGNDFAMSLFYSCNSLGYLLALPIEKMYSGCSGNRLVNRLFYLFYPLVLIISVIILKNTII